MSQSYSIKNVTFEISNDIVFGLYNLCYVGQIVDLGIHVDLLDRKGGSSIQKRNLLTLFVVGCVHLFSLCEGQIWNWILYVAK